MRELLQNAVDAVTARRAVEPEAPVGMWSRPASAGEPAVTWVGRSEGTYFVGPAQRESVGPTVTLTARPGSESWFASSTVVELAQLYGGLLLFPVVVGGQAVSSDGLPWRHEGRSAGQWRAEVVVHAHEMFSSRRSTSFRYACRRRT